MRQHHLAHESGVCSVADWLATEQWMMVRRQGHATIAIVHLGFRIAFKCGAWGSSPLRSVCVFKFGSIIRYPSTFHRWANRFPIPFHIHCFTVAVPLPPTQNGLYALLIRILRGYLNFQFDAVDTHNRPLLAAGCWLTGI